MAGYQPSESQIAEQDLHRQRLKGINRFSTPYPNTDKLCRLVWRGLANADSVVLVRRVVLGLVVIAAIFATISAFVIWSSKEPDDSIIISNPVTEIVTTDLDNKAIENWDYIRADGIPGRLVHLSAAIRQDIKSNQQWLAIIDRMRLEEKVSNQKDSWMFLIKKMTPATKPQELTWNERYRFAVAYRAFDEAKNPKEAQGETGFIPNSSRKPFDSSLIQNLKILVVVYPLDEISYKCLEKGFPADIREVAIQTK